MTIEELEKIHKHYMAYYPDAEVLRLKELMAVVKAVKPLARCEGYYRDHEWEELNKALEELEKEEEE